MTRHSNKITLLSILLLGLSACATVSQPDRAATPTSLLQAISPATSLTAQGQEPPWRAQVTDDGVTLTTGYTGAARTLALSQVEQSGVQTVIQAKDRFGSIRLALVREVCRDSMSGMPHPYSVVLSGVDGVQPGCGGQPLDLLTDREWIIQSLDGVAPIEDSPVTLNFLQDTGSIAGAGSCNRYHAGYTLDGESLRFAPAATTKMACSPDLMDQEQRFHAILIGIDRLDIDEQGHLILMGTNGQLIAKAASRTD